MLIGVIGAGGKSTACLRAAQALSDRSVLLTTTTHIYPVEPPACRVLLIDPELRPFCGHWSSRGSSARECRAGRGNCLPCRRMF